MKWLNDAIIFNFTIIKWQDFLKWCCCFLTGITSCRWLCVVLHLCQCHCWLETSYCSPASSAINPAWKYSVNKYPAHSWLLTCWTCTSRFQRNQQVCVKNNLEISLTYLSLLVKYLSWSISRMTTLSLGRNDTDGGRLQESVVQFESGDLTLNSSSNHSTDEVIMTPSAWNWF